MQSKSKQIAIPLLKHSSGYRNLKHPYQLDCCDHCYGRGVKCYGGRKEFFGCVPCTEWLLICNWNRNENKADQSPELQLHSKEIPAASDEISMPADFEFRPIIQPEQDQDIHSLAQAFSKGLAINGDHEDARAGVVTTQASKETLSDGDWTMVESPRKQVSQLNTEKHPSTPSTIPSKATGSHVGCSQPVQRATPRQTTPWPRTSGRYHKNPFLNPDGSPRNSPKPSDHSVGFPSSNSPGFSSKSIRSRPVSENTSAGSSSGDLGLFGYSFPTTERSSLDRNGKNEKRYGNGDGDDDEDEDEHDRSRPRKQIKHHNKPKDLLCPYFKRAPGKVMHESCSHNFSSVHRIKSSCSLPFKPKSKSKCPSGTDRPYREHLYRCHLVPQCFRCYQIFNDDEHLSQHLRSLVQCPLANNPRVCLTREQERRLRKKSSPKSSEEQKWHDVYQILFPDDEKPYPSPYREVLVIEQVHVPFSSALRRFESEYGAMSGALDQLWPLFENELRRYSVREPGSSDTSQNAIVQPGSRSRPDVPTSRQHGSQNAMATSTLRDNVNNQLSQESNSSGYRDAAYRQPPPSMAMGWPGSTQTSTAGFNFPSTTFDFALPLQPQTFGGQDTYTFSPQGNHIGQALPKSPHNVWGNDSADDSFF